MPTQIYMSNMGEAGWGSLPFVRIILFVQAVS